MSTVTLSPKYRVVIPKAICKSLKLSPGEKFCVMEYNRRVELIPLRRMRQMRGLTCGMDTQITREEDRF